VQIVVSPADLNFSQYEAFTLSTTPTKVGDLATATLNMSANVFHDGRTTAYPATVGLNGLTSQAFNIDQRAEVALLTRNIQIYGNVDVFYTGRKGVSIYAARTAALMNLTNVEIRYAGHFNSAERSAVMWDKITADPTVKNHRLHQSSIFKSWNRCVELRCSNGVSVDSNTCTDVTGHGFYISDGCEYSNIIRNNLVITTRQINIRKPTSPLTFTENMASGWGPAAFMLTSTRNHVLNNVAAGSQGPGFVIYIPSNFRAGTLSTCRDVSYTIDQVRTAWMGNFTQNTAHTVGKSALMISNNYAPTVLATINGFYAYRVNGGSLSLGVDQATPCISVLAGNIILTNIVCAEFNRALEIGSPNPSSSNYDPYGDRLPVSVTNSIFVAMQGLPADKTEVLGLVLTDGPVSMHNITWVNFATTSLVTSTYFNLAGGFTSSENTFSTMYFVNNLPNTSRGKLFASGMTGLARIYDVDSTTAKVLMIPPSSTGGSVIYNARQLVRGNTGTTQTVSIVDPLTAPSSGAACSFYTVAAVKEMVICPSISRGAFVQVSGMSGAALGSVQVSTSMGGIRDLAVRLFPVDHYQFFVRANIVNRVEIPFPAASTSPTSSGTTSPNSTCINAHIQSGASIPATGLSDASTAYSGSYYVLAFRFANVLSTSSTASAKLQAYATQIVTAATSRDDVVKFSAMDDARYFFEMETGTMFVGFQLKPSGRIVNAAGGALNIGSGRNVTVCLTPKVFSIASKSALSPLVAVVA
jgi:hypothetical protein